MKTLPVKVDFNYTLKEKNINDIRPGDTVFHNGHVRTVCKNNIEYGGFMGTTVFGDSYHSGYKPVIKILIIRVS